MPTALETLPATLAPRLSEDDLRLLADTPRSGRLEVLARGLRLSVDAALAELGRACGLSVQPAPRVAEDSLDLLPARLAHDFQAIPVMVRRCRRA